MLRGKCPWVWTGPALGSRRTSRQPWAQHSGSPGVLALKSKCRNRGTKPMDPHTYHTLHALGDIIVFLTVRRLHLWLLLTLTLSAQLQVSSQRPAASLIPADGTLSGQPLQRGA